MQVSRPQRAASAAPTLRFRDWLHDWQGRIDPEVHTAVWRCGKGADFDPTTFHDWPEYVRALTERARQWALKLA